MPDKKLTDAEIKKALECCTTNGASCKDCPAFVKVDRSNCKKYFRGALDLINRLQLDNEMLRTQNGLLVAEQELNIKGISATALKHKKEAYKEFAERLRKEFYYSAFTVPIITEEDLDDLLKEMVGEDK